MTEPSSNKANNTFDVVIKPNDIILSRLEIITLSYT